jgi:hypothetical protein
MTRPMSLCRGDRNLQSRLWNFRLSRYSSPLASDDMRLHERSTPSTLLVGSTQPSTPAAVGPHAAKPCVLAKVTHSQLAQLPPLEHPRRRPGAPVRPRVSSQRCNYAAMHRHARGSQNALLAQSQSSSSRQALASIAAAEVASSSSGRDPSPFGEA